LAKRTSAGHLHNWPLQRSSSNLSDDFHDDKRQLLTIAATMSRPTVTIFGADGSASSDSHPLPNVFKAPIRPDIVQYAQHRERWDGEGRTMANATAGACTLAWPRTRGSRTLWARRLVIRLPL